MAATRIETLAMKHQVRNYINGAVQQSVASDAAFIAPIVPVGSLVNTVWKYDRLTPYRIPDTRRAYGGKATVIHFGGTTEDVTLQPNALDTGIDYLQRSDEEIVMDLQSQVNLTTSAAGLGHFASVLATVQAAMTAASVTTTLDISDSDPIAVIDGLCKTILLSCGDAAGMMQLRFLWGWNAAAKVLADPDVIARVSGGATTDKPAKPTLAQLKGLFLYPNTVHRMGLAIKDTSEVGVTTEARSFVLDDEVLIVAASENPNKADPSAFKTFWKGSAGMDTRYYTTEDKRVEMFGLDWAFKIYAANAAASRRVTVQA
jgi:hypothetical protein